MGGRVEYSGTSHRIDVPSYYYYSSTPIKPWVTMLRNNPSSPEQVGDMVHSANEW